MGDKETQQSLFSLYIYIVYRNIFLKLGLAEGDQKLTLIGLNSLEVAIKSLLLDNDNLGLKYNNL
jgi:hypothetical protein